MHGMYSSQPTQFAEMFRLDTERLIGRQMLIENNHNNNWKNVVKTNYPKYNLPGIDASLSVAVWSHLKYSLSSGSSADSSDNSSGDSSDDSSGDSLDGSSLMLSDAWSEASETEAI